MTVVSPYTTSELVGSSVSHSITTPVEVGVGMSVPGITPGGILSISSQVVVFVFVFPLGSVIVTISSSTLTFVDHVPTIPIHSTSHEASAGVGVQVMFGIVTVAHSSTPVTVVITVVPLFAGLGLVVAFGSDGGVTSTIFTTRITSGAGFPLESVKLYLNVNVAITEVSTGHPVIFITDPFPSSRSEYVAQSSVYTDPIGRLNGVTPFKLMLGVSPVTTCTVLVASAIFPLESTTA